MRLILIRHGETLWNESRKFQGFSDIELSPKGMSQAKHLAEFLKQATLAKIYTSPLIRARQTAEQIARYHCCPISIVEELKELNQGRLEGLTAEDLRNNYPDFLRKWIEHPESARLPEGESLCELQLRAWAAVERMIREHPEDTVAAVAHSFVNLTILCRALGIPLDHFRRLGQDTAAINIIECSAKMVFLRCLNDTCHLKELK
ncbi:MAG: histidine phosphatase family protein [Deltaproteobacteria bacterium]|nr:histidine phosphatase family protein [Deltaproteobacteria bacterium]